MGLLAMEEVLLRGGPAALITLILVYIDESLLGILSVFKDSHDFHYFADYFHRVL